MIPDIETGRLRMTAPTEDHLPGEIGFWASERSKFVGGPQPARRVWRILAIWRGHWELRGYGAWSLVEKATGAHLGFAGIWHPYEWPEPEAAYHLFEGATGKGYATEAVRATLDFAYRRLGWKTLASFIAAENAASQNVARRLGAARSGETFRAAPDEPEVEIWRYPSPDALPEPAR